MTEPTDSSSLALVVVGHVDHGKSTLIGRLLADTGNLPEGKVEELRAISAKRGMPLEWSFVLDALQAERDQAVTIDTTRVQFRTTRRNCVIIDAPGHWEFLKNMISGAANADAALLVVDAVEGVRQQSRHHAYLLRMLGLRQIAVVVNKMDRIRYNADRFTRIRDELASYLSNLGLATEAVIPVCARDGDNLATRSDQMPWYDGLTLTEILDQFEPTAKPIERPLRVPIQDVYKFDDRRILVGRVESGILRVGDTLIFSPANRMAQVSSIETWNVPIQPITAEAGEAVGFTLKESLFVERGDIASHADNPPVLTDVFRAQMFWLGHDPLTVGAHYKLKLSTGDAMVAVQSIERIIDTEFLVDYQAEQVPVHSVAEVILRANRMLALDEFVHSPATGRCILVNGYDTVAIGILSMEGYPDQRQSMAVRSSNTQSVDHLVTPITRALRYGHTGAVIWFTGLSGAGKSTLAMQVEQRLFNKGFHVYVLDGDNIRDGLNVDLAFTPEDRTENIRRVGEVAALFADAGLLVITAFISPYRSDRERARKAAGKRFHEVYVKADLKTCESRDPKGLYKKARAGIIREFTGISAPYEPPDNPDLVVDTTGRSVEECIDQVVNYILDTEALTVPNSVVSITRQPFSANGLSTDVAGGGTTTASPSNSTIDQAQDYRR